jgi:hypothetical protein
MKKWLLASLMVLEVVTTAYAEPFPPIVRESQTPSLRSDNVWIDASTGTLRGTVYLNHGYNGPRLPHVHVYGLGHNRKILFSACAELSDYFLHFQPRTNLNPQDSFSIPLPASYSRFREVVVVTDSDHRCNDHHDVEPAKPH